MRSEWDIGSNKCSHEVVKVEKKYVNGTAFKSTIVI